MTELLLAIVSEALAAAIVALAMTAVRRMAEHLTA